MPRINEHYLKLRAAYLFAEIRRRQKAFGDAHPDARVIDLGVGDVTRPLPPAVVRAIHEAADDMAGADTFKGYGPYVGYEWLRAEIAAQDFGTRGVTIAPDEVFVSDGGKSDSANLQEIFARDAVVALMDPVYPVYADSNVVAGRSGAADASGRYAGMVYLPCVAENAFQPALPERRVDLIYLCYPNNPTGAVATRAALKRWVDYAREHEAVIFYDAAYAAYIWFRTPAGVSSWDFFDRLLTHLQIVGAPGAGFGPSGEGYFRLTAFGSREQTEEAVERIRARLQP